MLISGEILGQEFERDLSAQPGVLSQINLAHSAGGQRRNNLVRTDLLAGKQSAKGIGKEVGGHFVSRQVEKTSILLVRSQERFHLHPQSFIVAAGLAQEAGTLLGRARQRRMKELVDLLPAIGFYFRCHYLVFCVSPDPGGALLEVPEI